MYCNKFLQKMTRGFNTSIFKLILASVFSIFLLNACKQMDLYEKSVNIPNLQWQNNFNAKGSFDIVDSTSIYKIFIVIRHTDAYDYNNIWLNVGLQPPGEANTFQKINVKLGSDATGWSGVGMNDIWEEKYFLTRMPLKKGVYSFDISHIMRDNPLPHIMSVGIRVEKTP
jgi:gliding motility-associated lipoprotein GldH